MDGVAVRLTIAIDKETIIRRLLRAFPLPSASEAAHHSLPWSRERCLLHTTAEAINSPIPAKAPGGPIKIHSSAMSWQPPVVHVAAYRNV